MDKPIPEGVRDAFEAWARKRHGLGVERWHDSGEYRYEDTRRWWEAWQAALTAAQQQGEAVAFDIERARTLADYVVGYARAGELKSLSSDACVALSDLHSMLHAQPMQQGGGEVLARGWLHRRGPGDDYDLHDESSGAGKDCAKCVPCVILRADTAPPSAPVGVDAAKHWHDLYRKECQLRQDDAARYGQQIVDLEALAQQPAAARGDVRGLSDVIAQIRFECKCGGTNACIYCDWAGRIEAALSAEGVQAGEVEHDAFT